MEKSFKLLAKEAKNRIKNGFWESKKVDLKERVSEASRKGMNAGKVERYFTQQITGSIRNEKNKEEEEFYQKVKDLLLSEGEVSNAIGRLTDKAYYDSLSYEEKQRYTLDLSQKYLHALERFKRECEFEGKA